MQQCCKYKDCFYKCNSIAFLLRIFCLRILLLPPTDGGRDRPDIVGVWWVGAERTGMVRGVGHGGTFAALLVETAKKAFLTPRNKPNENPLLSKDKMFMQQSPLLYHLFCIFQNIIKMIYIGIIQSQNTLECHPLIHLIVLNSFRF